MSIFGWTGRLEGGKDASAAGDAAKEVPPDTASARDEPKGPPNPPRSRIRRVGYSVRVRPSFKSEVLLMVARRQLQSQPPGGGARRVTEGEFVELMLDTYKTFLRNGELVGRSVPIPTVVWEGLEQIARELQLPVADAFEQLVVEKLNTLK